MGNKGALRIRKHCQVGLQVFLELDWHYASEIKLSFETYKSTN
jgi:guanylate kinase